MTIKTMSECKMRPAIRIQIRRADNLFSLMVRSSVEPIAEIKRMTNISSNRNVLMAHNFERNTQVVVI